MKVKENNRCSYCPDIVDYIEHFFCECPVVQNLWLFTEKSIYVKTDLILKLSTTDRLFGVSNSGQVKGNYRTVNILILIAKMCISIFKKTESALSLQSIMERELRLRNLGTDS